MPNDNKLALSFVQETIKLCEQIEGSFLSLAARLKKIRDEELWRPAGYSAYEEFLGETRVSPATASKLVTLYERFVVELGVDQGKLGRIGWSSLYDLTKVVKTKQDAQEWLEKATLLKRDDLVEEVRIALGKVDPNCQHKNTYTLEICEDCGKRFKKLD